MVSTAASRMRSAAYFVPFVLTANIFGACATKSEPALTPAQLGEMLEKNPQILANAIEKNPDAFMEAAQKAAQKMQAREQEKSAEAEKAKFEAELKNPLQPTVQAERGFMGDANAPLTIVEYTDFQCPYCVRGYSTIEQVLKNYEGKVKVFVKNLPLPMHPMAVPAAKRFEALRLQDAKKATAFYHAMFADQAGLNKDGEKFLDAAVKKTGADVARVKRDMDSDKVKAIIDADVAEAEKFSFSGTPAFIVDGVSVRGAYPFETFKQILDRKLASAK